MKKILLLLSFFLVAFAFQATAQQKTQTVTERAIQRAAAKTTPQQKLKNLEQRLVKHEKLLNDPSYASEQYKIKATIEMIEKKIVAIKKELNQ